MPLVRCDGNKRGKMVGDTGVEPVIPSMSSIFSARYAISPRKMELPLNGEELSRILCLLAPGMSLTVPDEWVDRIMAGSLRDRISRVEKIAMDYGCSLRQGVGVQTFEKLELPATG
jgi:hypothetical protein